MRITNVDIEAALPILMRAQREAPSPWLEELLERMQAAAHNRGLVALMALLELQARDAGAVQSEGPAVAGPSAVEREAKD